MKTLTILNQSTGIRVGNRIACAETSLSRLVAFLERAACRPEEVSG
jgi:hypothetical protein